MLGVGRGTGLQDIHCDTVNSEVCKNDLWYICGRTTTRYPWVTSSPVLASREIRRSTKGWKGGRVKTKEESRVELLSSLLPPRLDYTYHQR